MALFDSNLALALTNRMIIDTLDLTVNTDAGSAADCFITLHSGAQPTANDLLNDWNSYRWPASSFLGGASCSIELVSPSNTTFTLSTGQVNVPANNNGTATWAVIWSTRSYPTSGTVVTRSTGSFVSSIPTEQFFVVPVSSNTATTGIVRMQSTDMTVGSYSTISEITFQIG